MTSQQSTNSYLPVELPYQPHVTVVARYRSPFWRVFSDAPFGFVRFGETELEYRAGFRVKTVAYRDITEVDARRSFTIGPSGDYTRLAIRAPGPRRLVFEFSEWQPFITSLRVLQWAGCPVTPRALNVAPG